MAIYSKKQKLIPEKNTNRWSLSNSTLFLDELFDSGVKLLESGSDSSDGDDQKNGSDSSDVIDSSCKHLTPESRERRVREKLV